MIILYRATWFLLMWAFFTTLNASTLLSSTDSLIQQTYTLNQISKINTGILEGRKPSYTFYIPIPSQWEVLNIDLNLIIQFSPLLLNSSSLTLMVGDLPIDSIKLDKAVSQPILWRVSIPKALIQKKITTVRLIGYMKISDDVCSDVENPGNWITLVGNSSVTYHYQNRSENLKLSDFPYPFIHNDAPFVDKIAFVMPDKMTANDFAPYFNLANILSKRASWRGIDFETILTNDVGHISSSNPAIIVSTPDLINFSSLKFPNGIHLEHNQWMQNGTRLSDDSGFIWIYPNKQQPVLVISANTQQGIATAINSINSNVMNFNATNPSLFIATPTDIDQPISESPKKLHITFKDLGYNDNTVFGSGQNQLNYQFNLPDQFSNSPVTLFLDYSFSPFLQQNKASTLTINLNGYPVDGALLKTDSAQKVTLELNLPPKLLHLGNNALIITFNMILPEEYCTRDYLNEAWATVYNDSYLEFHQSKAPESNQIKSYPTLMNGLVFVGLPNNGTTTYQNKQLLQELIHFATTLNNSSFLKVMDNQSLPKDSVQHNLVYLSIGKNDSEFMISFRQNINKLIHNLSITSNNTLKGIDKNIFGNAFDKRQDIGFVNISPLGSYNQFALLNIFGYTEDELKLALNLLNDNYKRDSLSGTLAVSFQNGSYTNLSPQEIQDTVNTEIAMEKANRLTLNVIIYSLAGIGLTILAFVIWRFIKKCGS